MRKGMVWSAVVAVLALPAIGLGANLSMSLSATDLKDVTNPGNGTSSIDIDVSSLPLDILITVDAAGDPVDGVSFGYNVTGASSLAFTGAGWANGTLFAAGDIILPVGGASPPAGSDIRDPNNGGPFTGNSWFKTFGQAIPPGVLNTLQVTNTAALAIGDTLIVELTPSVINPPGTVGPGCVSTVDVCDATAGTLAINIVPEPASALLLLAVVPFLRRRRMA